LSNIINRLAVICEGDDCINVVAVWRDDGSGGVPSLAARIPYPWMTEKSSGGGIEGGSKKIEK
jgi:hypothetical protein